MTHLDWPSRMEFRPFCFNEHMAKKETVTVAFTSDLSGKEITDNDAPTVTYGWDGTTYEIDLTTDEAGKFYKAVEKYIAASRKASRPVGRKTRTKAAASTGGPSAAEIREWGKSNGYDVPDRGRIPGAVRDAFDAAN